MIFASTRSRPEVSKRQGERRNLAHDTLGPDTAIVTVDDALDRGEADARALEPIRGMQPLERAQESVGIGHIEAGTIVPNDKNGFAVVLNRPDLDRCL
jgi:hypothetical protein